MPENKALIEKELLLQRNKLWSEAQVLAQVKKIFDEQGAQRERITDNLEADWEATQNAFDLDSLLS